MDGRTASPPRPSPRTSSLPCLCELSASTQEEYVDVFKLTRDLHAPSAASRSPLPLEMADLPPPPPPPYAAVSPPSQPRLEALPYDVLIRILRYATLRYVFLADRHAAIWWLVREVRLVSRTLRDGASLSPLLEPERAALRAAPDVL